jgi:hypothetical protein
MAPRKSRRERLVVEFDMAALLILISITTPAAGSAAILFVAVCGDG